jgi:hypothetical protein
MRQAEQGDADEERNLLSASQSTHGAFLGADPVLREDVLALRA